MAAKPQGSAAARDPAAALIRMENVVARAGGAEILKGLSLSVVAGEFVALVGPNGAGKTTLLRHLNGLRKPNAGRVLIDGVDTRKGRTSELAKTVGFLFQNPDHQIVSSSVRAEIEFGLKHCGIPAAERPARIAEAAAAADVSALLDHDPFSLSRAARQRVALASVLAVGPRVLVLDEPTSSQDERGATLVMEVAAALNRRGTTVIMVSHDMELVARYARRALVLADGRLLADRDLDSLFSDEELLDHAGLSMPGAYRMARALGLDAATLHGSGAGACSVDSLVAAVAAARERVSA